MFGTHDSISRKLTWMNMLVSGAALLLAGGAFVAYDLIRFRETMVRNLSIQAEIVGSNSASALLFSDATSAAGTLLGLKAAPNIMSAGIYNPAGEPFAAYWRDGGNEIGSLPPMPSAQMKVHWFTDRQITLVRPIVFQGKTVGNVYIQSDLQDLNDRLRRYMAIAAGVLLASLMAAMLMSSVFRRAIAEPIVHLAEIAETVSREKIYSLRASATGSHDELDTLIETFNEMLAQIQERDTALLARVAERTRAEQALQVQTRILQSVLDSMEEGLIAADENGKFTLWNPAAEKILGRAAADLPIPEWAEHYGTFMPDQLTPFPTDQLPLVRAIRGESCDVEMFVRNPKLGEGACIEISGRPLRDERGAVHGGVVAFRDVTETKASAQEIRKLHEELEVRVIQRTAQLQAANQELESFTYSVSHDLRAPLRHISGFSKILVEEFGASLAPEARRYLQRIQEATSRMGVLVDDLLNLARIGRKELRREVTGLNSLVQDVIFDLKLESEGRQVEWKVSNLPFVECDPSLIKQVMQNLLSNALKYSRPRSSAVIEIGQQQENEKSVVFVRDNGVGFSMKYADKLFGVFQRLHRTEDFEGTGVGLATVQRIIHKHGGQVWAEAELDKGATFYFTIGVTDPTGIKSQAAMAGVQS